MVRGNSGKCQHCGEQTRFAWVDTATPDENPIHVCVTCMNEAKVGHFATPAYERVGQATYKPLLKRPDAQE